MSKQKVIYIRVDEIFHRRLKKLAKNSGFTLNSFIKGVLNGKLSMPVLQGYRRG
jgi:predicted HicB family RNase H-like nuclease